MKTKRVRLTQELFVKRSTEKHGGKFTYQKAIFTVSHDFVTVTCPEHGDFQIKAYSHLQGIGCSKCGDKRSGDKRRTPLATILKRAKQVHGDRYDYSNCTHENFAPICKIHGSFKQAYKGHLSGQGCPKCNIGGRYTTEQFVIKARSLHGDKYDYSQVDYQGTHVPVKIICPTHGAFMQRPETHILQLSNCPKCANTGPSRAEDELVAFIDSLGVQHVQSYRKLIGPKEVDVYLPDHNLAIEFNGLYWHSDEFHDKGYHIGKRLSVEGKSCRLISIREDLWNERKYQVKNIIRHAVGIAGEKVYARKTCIVPVERETVKQFMEKNHVQGYRGATVSYGLEYDGKIVAILSLTHWKNKNQWEVIRYATNCNVVGGLSKLWKYSVNALQIDQAFTYIDRDLFTGSSYCKAGFTFDSCTVGFRIIVKNGKTESRQKWNKAPEGMTQLEWYKSEGVRRIFDSGQDKLIFKI